MTLRLMRRVAGDGTAISNEGERSAEQAAMTLDSLFRAYHQNAKPANATELRAAIDGLFAYCRIHRPIPPLGLRLKCKRSARSSVVSFGDQLLFAGAAFGAIHFANSVEVHTSTIRQFNRGRIRLASDESIAKSVANTRANIAPNDAANSTMKRAAPTREHARLAEPHAGPLPPWRKWGPYVSDRSWGTVREDYSADGNAWDFLTHDQARSKAYRWGEDGIAGICDRYQLLVFALAFWNGRDPILKERMFGLSCNEGNHGEDAKEYWFHLDNTPTHSYMRMLYKYPQREYPYQQLIDENRSRRGGPEFELLDTGIFDDDRYFDIFIEYAKESPEDICIRIEAFNRGPRRGRASFPAASVVPQHLELGRIRRRCQPSIQCGAGRQGQHVTSGGGRFHRQATGEHSIAIRSRPALLVCAVRRRAALHRQRNERVASLRALGRQPFSVCERCIPSLRREWRAVRESTADRHQGVHSLSRPDRGGKFDRVAAPPDRSEATDQSSPIHFAT